jgi:hypothetical protein
MVAVDSDEVWTAGQDFFADELADMLDYPGAIPGQGANHAVEVVGVDTSDPDHPMVILNDPGHPQGQGLMMPAEEFIDAWADSGSYMVATTGEAPESLPDEGHPYPGSLPAPAAWEERAAATGYNPGQYSGLAATPTPADDDFVAYRRGLLEEIRAEKGDAAAAAQEDAWNNQGGEELREERRQFELEQEKLDPNFSQDEYDARLEQARLIEAEAQRHREETLAEVEVIEEELRENDLDAFRNPYIDDDDDDDD